MQWFSERSGLTNHMKTQHATFSQQTLPPLSPLRYASPEEVGQPWDNPAADSFDSFNNEPVDAEKGHKGTHPFLNGK